MPEYLAPGVYVEETSFRAKTIEGVSTSTAAFVGPTRFGPVDGVPDLVTSFGEFERVYGGLDQLEFDGGSGATHNYVAHGVRGFFDNGGKRLYVARVVGAQASAASTTLAPRVSPPVGFARLSARHPGRAGAFEVTFRAKLGGNVLSLGSDGQNLLQGVREHDTVWVQHGSSPASTGALYSVKRSINAGQRWELEGNPPLTVNGSGGLEATRDAVHIVTIEVEVTFPGRPGRPNEARTEQWEGLAPHPAHARSISRTFAVTLDNRQAARSVPLVFEVIGSPVSAPRGPEIVALIFGSGQMAPQVQAVTRARLANGSDGRVPTPDHYAGAEADGTRPSTGLKSLESVPDVSIVAAPGYSVGEATAVRQIMANLISHCERMRYRIAVLDCEPNQGLQGVRQFRAQIDSSHAALYYPWVRVLDPITDQEVNLPPSGFVCGIYARNDIESGVHKAPANEVVRGAISFERLLNKSQQDVLNPEGVNCFRYFEGRGYRLWGARTVSSDPEWKYVNLRRYFAFLERSIDVGTQWVVFEPNGAKLWANVRRTVESFLFNEWKSGHLLGEKPEQAYFVRCDRSTMTQNDLDNGRIVCLIGVAPLRPAEFVIFRIGQFTADQSS